MWIYIGILIWKLATFNVSILHFNNMVENKENWERLNLHELFWLMFLPNVNITLRFSFFSNSLEKVFKLSFFGHIWAFYKSVFNLIIRLWAISASTQVLDLWENIWVSWPFNIQFATLRHHTAADGRHFIDNTDKSSSLISLLLFIVMAV